MGEKKRSFYGWGFEGDAVSAEELGWFERAWSELFRVDCFDPAPMPRESEIALRAPRMSLPAALKLFCTTDKYDRLLHCYGRSVHDLARMIHRRDFSNPPDLVAYPRNEDEIRAVLDWCGANNFAAIPYGMVGAGAALWITGSPFGFMAFLGIISLIFGLLLLIYPYYAAALLSFVVGGFAIVMGLCSIYFAFAARKSPKPAAA